MLTTQLQLHSFQLVHLPTGAVLGPRFVPPEGNGLAEPQNYYTTKLPLDCWGEHPGAFSLVPETEGSGSYSLESVPRGGCLPVSLALAGQLCDCAGTWDSCSQVPCGGTANSRLRGLKQSTCVCVCVGG